MTDGPTTAVILAGGRGTRLSEETVARPKPMVCIGEEPILWHIMKTYANAGIVDFIVCLGYLGWQVKDYFVNRRLRASDVSVDLRSGEVTFHHTNTEPWRVTLVETGDATQTGGRLRRVGAYLDVNRPFCMTYGDGVCDVDVKALVAFHMRHGRLASVTAVRPPARFGSLACEDSRVVEFSEKRQQTGGTGLINGGYFVLSPEVLSYIDGDDTAFEREPLEALAQQAQLMAFHHDGFWCGMDTIRDRDELRALWNSGGAPWKRW